jgi:hypothetical protein
VSDVQVSVSTDVTTVLITGRSLNRRSDNRRSTVFHGRTDGPIVLGAPQMRTSLKMLRRQFESRMNAPESLDCAHIS